MIDLSHLSQEQRWGLDFAVMQANSQIQSSNAKIAEINLSRTPGTPPVPLQDLWTTSTYLVDVVRSACDSYYESLLRHKERVTLETFYAMPPEQQAAILSQLGIPDVIPATS